MKKIKIIKNKLINKFRVFMIYFSYFSKIRVTNVSATNNANPLIKNKKNNNEIERKLPMIIWSYWHSNPPDIVNISIGLLKKQNPDWDVRFLDSVSVGEYLDIDFTKLNALTYQQISDVIRLELLYQYGGVWIDSSVLVFESFHKFKYDIETSKVDILGYYRESNNTSSEMPVLENWFLVSFKESESIKIWKTEFYKALSFGVENYIEKIRKNNISLLANLYDPNYLVCYVAFQSILNRINSYKLYDCDKSAFLFHITGDFDYFITKRKGWSSLALIRGLFINKSSGNIPAMIKLTSKDRCYFEFFYSKKIFLSESIASTLKSISNFKS